MTPRRTILIAFLLAMLMARPAGSAVDQPPIEPELAAAISSYRAVGADLALPEFERLHALYEKNGDRVHVARAERYIGESHWRLGNYEQSREHLERALGSMREMSMRLAEGKTLNVLGLLEWDLGHYEAAIANFEMASLIGSETGDKRLAGATMNNLSLVYDELGDYGTSLKQYQQALELYDGANFPRGESDTLGNIGGVNLLLGRFREALNYYQRALAISESLESRPSMSLDHGNLALCYLGLGDVDEALRHFDLALQLARETGMRKEEALWQRGKGNALIRKGQYDPGLEIHRAALATYEEINARGLLVDSLHDMGRLHLSLGDPVSAEQYFQRGMELAREIGLAQAVTMNLLALGDLDFSRENFEEAEALYRQANQRATTAGELNFQAESLLRLALVEREQNRLGQAEKDAGRALEIAREIDAVFMQAEASYALGELARYQGKVDVALERYDNAQSMLGEFGDPDLLWQIHYGRAQLLILAEKRREAVVELQAAVRIIENVREQVREDRFKAGYIQDKYKVYIDLVRLQLELGLTPEAFSTAERLRARTFLDRLGNASVLARNEQESQYEFALRERVRQLQEALLEEQKTPPPDRRQLAIDSFSSELLVAEREYQAYLDDLKSHMLGAPDSSPHSLTEIQAQLNEEDALLEFVIDDRQVMTFVVRNDSLSAVITELRYSDLEAKVGLVRELIQDPASNSWWLPAASLSDSLFRPLQQGGLLNGVSHLYLVPHGILNYLPFSLLPLSEASDERVLMEQFTLSYLPAAAMLALESQAGTTAQSLLALAPANSRLQYALEEARSISELYKPDAHLLLGQAATESAFKEQAGSYTVLHLSTHGFFNLKNPLFSGLELEPDGDNDGHLEVHEILGLSLDASLVTLSACDTGLGSGYFNELPAGDEFVGLTRAFLLAGSRSVLATLWEVDDRSTGELMDGFYRQLHQSGDASDQAYALTRIQRKLRSSTAYRHPFYWAPFVLVGQQHRRTHART